VKSALDSLIRVVDGLNAALFRLAATLPLLLTLLVFSIVVLRYAAGWGSTAMQESALYLHASGFMLAAAWGLRRGDHVRVDVFSARFSDRGRLWVELFGALLLLLPFAAFLLFLAWDYVGRAWAIRERSMESGGLPYVYLLKTLILVLAVQLILQALAEAARAWQALRKGAA
jgi:TRAP-type mannitol/chloroaromatic compound transport system permease small subunit